MFQIEYSFSGNERTIRKLNVIENKMTITITVKPVLRGHL